MSTILQAHSFPYRLRASGIAQTVLLIFAAGFTATADFNPAEVAKKTLPAVVSIRVKTAAGDATGSGFIVDSSGTIVTNLHVIRGAISAAVKLANGDVYDEFQVRAFDERKDLVIIQIAAFGLPTVPLGDSEKVEPGQRVMVVGNPLGVLEGSVSVGVVSGVRSLDGYKVLQTDATANHGSSGGPMLDENGAVIGVVTFKLAEGKAENLNFAVPINYARGMLSGASQSLSLADLERSVGKTKDLFSSSETKSYPDRWKSVKSGARNAVRVDGEYLYVEGLFPEDTKRRGGFRLAEMRKTTSGYTGMSRIAVVGSFVRWTGEKVVNRCTFEDPIEITLLTPTRIEGSGPHWDKMDIAKCSRENLRSDPFVWIPE